jgi:hypothetical protein
MIASALLLFSFNVDVIMGIPSGFVEGDYLFGITVGVVDDENVDINFNYDCILNYNFNI